MIGQINHICY